MASSLAIVLGTRFTDMFGLEHPVMSAPMAGHSGGDLAAAVAAAGGLGSFGGLAPGRGPGWITEQVAAIRAVTDRPFAIGFITPFLPMAAPLLDEAVALQPAAICLSFSDPGPWADRVRDVGARLICQVQNLDGADAAVAAGADVLIAQGIEAGGHTGTMSTLPLLASVVARHPDTPVLAAGGIGDGSTMAAAMVAGAEGVVMGTAFLATPEATDVPDAFKELVVASDGTDTVLTRAYDIVGGYPFPSPISDRMRANSFTADWAGREEELGSRKDEFRTHLALDDDFDPEVYTARYGQAAAFVAEIRPAKAVIHAVVEEAESILRSRPDNLRAT